ncbi:hypothetical protein FRC09_003634 [Ceratobasidium sp. 395]|nr:hypothetical protein FRC09_003634 [Ceratobasidium sp. 395]
MKLFAVVLLALSTVASATLKHKRRPAVGTCQNPVKHVEWRSLTQAQRDSFHNAVKCLRAKGTDQGMTQYDLYPSVHDKLYDQAHYVAQFLPWHRMFLWLRRLDLQDCGYGGPTPYWDWTIDSGKLSTSKIWDPVAGFGGNGNTNTQDHCVENGPYADFWLSYPSPHCLSRQFNNGNTRSKVLGTMQGNQYSKKTVDDILSNGNYLDFSTNLEEVPHDAIHNVIAGDMEAAFSPNDAMFFLHHQNIDRLWAQWQGRGSRLQEYGGNTIQGQSQTDDSKYPLAQLSDVMPMMGIRGHPDMRVSDVMDTQGGFLCYKYDK